MSGQACAKPKQQFYRLKRLHRLLGHGIEADVQLILILTFGRRQLCRDLRLLNFESQGS